MAMTSCLITVEIADLQNAAAAVLPHADTPKLGDELLALARVRVVADKDELFLLATNGRTTGLAAMPILDDDRRTRFAADDGRFVVDVHPAKLRDIVAGLVPQKHEGVREGVGEITLTLEFISGRDATGLWPGSITERPLLAYSTDYPDVFDALKRALAEASMQGKALVADGADLAAFRAASRAYERPLRVEPIGTPEQRGFLVLCGSQFIGTISSRHNDDNSLAVRESERRRHLERFGLAERLAEVGI